MAHGFNGLAPLRGAPSPLRLISPRLKPWAMPFGRYAARPKHCCHVRPASVAPTSVRRNPYTARQMNEVCGARGIEPNPGIDGYRARRQ